MSTQVLAECSKYALDQKLEIPEPIYPFVEQIMSNRDSAGVWREEIVSNYLNLRHNKCKHGYDAYDNNNYPVEIKSETQVGSNPNNITKLNGSTAFGISTFEKLEQIKEDNPLIIVSGWSRSGVLVYIVSFLFNNSGLYENLKKSIGTSTAPKGTWMHFPSTYKVLFYNTKYQNLISRNFKAEIEANL